MTVLPWLLVAVLGLARADDEVAGTASDSATQSDVSRAMQETLRRDPAVAASLAARILRSSIADRISTSADPAQRLGEIRKWVDANPDAAAHLAVGLAQDDQEGAHRFEQTVLRNTDRSFQIDAARVRDSTYGQLKKSSLDSKLMRADGAMSEEEKREILKTMFEGQGGMSNQIITEAKDDKRPGGAAGAPGAAGLAAGYYDRLSRLNLRGYSPQLMAIQSALNQRRAPGAPKLLETGKLDYETLSYPAYGMRYDLRNLETRLRLQENLELARLAGLEGRYRPEQLLDPQVEALLKQKTSALKTSPRFAARRIALERAAAALRDFEAAALRARDPNGITRGLLADLGSKQKEAARWITVASLEEELQRIESEAGFLSPELKALIAGCPVAEASRGAYQRRGEGFEQALLKMKANAEDSIRRLEADDWQATVAAVEAALAENAVLRKDLSRNIRDFVKTPFQLRSLYAPQPRWRGLLEGALERYLPGTSWGRRLRERSRQRATLADVFAKIATGDLEAAHTILASTEPGPVRK
ncbi:MAG: hypothetical protein NTY77_20265 [Elusimicrobia bacterium]|nr:hypothetical protein [Elusimicrobiota bacterium]